MLRPVLAEETFAQEPFAPSVYSTEVTAAVSAAYAPAWAALAEVLDMARVSRLRRGILPNGWLLLAGLEGVTDAMILEAWSGTEPATANMVAVTEYLPRAVKLLQVLGVWKAKREEQVLWALRQAGLLDILLPHWGETGGPWDGPSLDVELGVLWWMYWQHLYNRKISAKPRLVLENIRQWQRGEARPSVQSILRVHRGNVIHYLDAVRLLEGPEAVASAARREDVLAALKAADNDQIRRRSYWQCLEALLGERQASLSLAERIGEKQRRGQPLSPDEAAYATAVTMTIDEKRAAVAASMRAYAEAVARGEQDPAWLVQRIRQEKYGMLRVAMRVISLTRQFTPEWYIEALGWVSQYTDALPPTNALRMKGEAAQRFLLTNSAEEWYSAWAAIARRTPVELPDEVGDEPEFVEHTTPEEYLACFVFAGLSHDEAKEYLQALVARVTMPPESPLCSPSDLPYVQRWPIVGAGITTAWLQEYGIGDGAAPA